MKKPPVKVSSLAEALVKARRYCAYQERSHQEVRDKLYNLGLHRREVEQGIALLIGEGFINEQRFAETFAGGKFRVRHWGKIKIRQALKAKQVTDYCIRKALDAIDDREYSRVMQKIIDSRMKVQKEKNPVRRNYLVANYVIGRGFEPELVWDALRVSE